MTHEEVGGHDHGHIHNGHLIFLFIVYYSLEKFKQGLQCVAIHVGQEEDQKVQSLQLLLLGWKILHGLEGFEVLATEQRLGQLADEQLQQAGCIVLLDTFPVKSLRKTLLPVLGKDS